MKVYNLVNDLFEWYYKNLKCDIIETHKQIIDNHSPVHICILSFNAQIMMFIQSQPCIYIYIYMMLLLFILNISTAAESYVQYHLGQKSGVEKFCRFTDKIYQATQTLWYN